MIQIGFGVYLLTIHGVFAMSIGLLDPAENSVDDHHTESPVLGIDMNPHVPSHRDYLDLDFRILVQGSVPHKQSDVAVRRCVALNLFAD